MNDRTPRRCQSARSRVLSRSGAAIVAGLALGLLVAACSPATPTSGPGASGSSPAASAGSAAPDPSAGPSGAAASAGASASAPASASKAPRPSASPAAFHCSAAHGTLVDRSYRSAVAGRTVRYRVYLPPCYASSNRRYPYVILFHGSLGDQREWTDTMHVDQAMDRGIKAGTLAPMILVMPGGGDLANSAIFTNGKSYESVVLNEIIPRVEKEFATFGTRAGREIGGISRGGFWAFSIAFRHPDLFAAVGGHSPFFWPTNAPPSSNPLDLAEDVHFRPGQTPRIWVDVGEGDRYYALPNITPFVGTLEDRDIDLQFTLYPTGGHAVSYWRSHVKTYLTFYGKSWPKKVEDLPLRKP